MNWFRENRFLGTFLSVLAACTVTAFWFLFSAKSAWDDTASEFNQTAAELNRLERLTPYPSDENLRKMRAHADGYSAALTTLKEELGARMLPAAPMAPNEFQSHLRLAMTEITEKARTNKVRLPDKFHLGFDEFVSALPTESAAPLLGQELAQIEWLLETMFEARVDALTSFHRTPSSDEHGMVARSVTPTGRKPGAGTVVDPGVLERHVVEATFVSTPAAARKVLNQIAGVNQHFLIVRLLHVRNENDKGPPREVGSDSPGGTVAPPSPALAGSPGAQPISVASLNFIVGNERVEIAAKIEMVRFTFLMISENESQFPGSARALACWLRRLAATHFYRRTEGYRDTNSQGRSAAEKFATAGRRRQHARARALPGVLDLLGANIFPSKHP